MSSARWTLTRKALKALSSRFMTKSWVSDSGVVCGCHDGISTADLHERRQNWKAFRLLLHSFSFRRQADNFPACSGTYAELRLRNSNAIWHATSSLANSTQNINFNDTFLRRNRSLAATNIFAIAEKCAEKQSIGWRFFVCSTATSDQKSECVTICGNFRRRLSTWSDDAQDF